jgi:hypothetical protein
LQERPAGSKGPVGREGVSEKGAAQMAIQTAEPPVAASEVERSKRRKVAREDESDGRYFLVKTSSGDKIELAEEAASENEAMITAFRTGGRYAVVTEWKAVADLSNGEPVIKKEAVRKEKK